MPAENEQNPFTNPFGRICTYAALSLLNNLSDDQKHLTGNNLAKQLADTTKADTLYELLLEHHLRAGETPYYRDTPICHQTMEVLEQIRKIFA